jgi:hypothetical protein
MRNVSCFFLLVLTILPAGGGENPHGGIILISAFAEKTVYGPGNLMFVKVILENKGSSPVRVPKSFSNTLGAYPSSRIGFVSRSGNELMDRSGEAWPENPTLSASAIPEKTILLPSGAFYGRTVPAVSPEGEGCYSLVVVFSSWKKVDDVQVPNLEPILLGDTRSSPSEVKVCVKAPESRK